MLLGNESEIRIAQSAVRLQAVHSDTRPLPFVVLDANGKGEVCGLVNGGNEQLDTTGTSLRLHTHFVATFSFVVAVVDCQVIAAFVEIDEGVGINVLEFSSSGRAHVHFVTTSQVVKALEEILNLLPITSIFPEAELAACFPLNWVPSKVASMPPALWRVAAV